MKKTISLIVLLAMIVTLFSGCHRPGEEGETTKLSLNEQVRVAANNIQNGCDFATDGEFLYCSDWDDGIEFFPQLLKVSMDDFSVVSSYATKMPDGTEFNPSDVICIDDTIHYSCGTVLQGIYSEHFLLNTKMEESVELPFTSILNRVSTDGTYYYASDVSFFGDFGLYRASVDDIMKGEQDAESAFTKISEIYTSRIILQGDYLYVMSYEAIINGVENENAGTWRMNLDGSDPIRILNYSPDMLLVSGNKLYTLEDDGVYSMSLDGTDRFLLSEVYTDANCAGCSINITDEYIFYTHEEYRILHRANLDGTNDVQLNNFQSGNITVAGDWIIYMNDQDNNYYKMRFDGTNHCLISETPLEEEPTEATETAEVPIVTEPMVQTQGSYTLEEAQAMEGLFILYPDGSFDRYYGGYVLTWNTQPMTYGSDSFPEDLIISTSRMDRNKSALNGGQLVIFWPYDNRVRDGLYAVEESGYSLFRTDDEGDLEGLILTRNSATGSLKQWNQGHTFYWSNSINYTTINGIPKEQYDGFPSTEGRDFGSFPAHQTFTIGVVEGTKLVEKEYETDHMYFLHAESSSPYTLTPTTDGYAIFDFSDTPSGEYVYTVSRWDPDRRARRVVSTYIVIE